MLASIAILNLDEAGDDRLRGGDGDADRRDVGRRHAAVVRRRNALAACTRTQAWRRAAPTRIARPARNSHEPRIPRSDPADARARSRRRSRPRRRCCATGARGTRPSTRSPRASASGCSTSSTAHDTHVCVPMQGSGTFSVEAAVNTLVPRDGHVLVLINGAYGKRHREAHADDGPQDVDVRDRRRRADDGRTTSTGCSRGSVDHARRPDPLRDVDRHPESAAGDRGGRRAPRHGA